MKKHEVQRIKTQEWCWRYGDLIMFQLGSTEIYPLPQEIQLGQLGIFQVGFIDLSFAKKGRLLPFHYPNLYDTGQERAITSLIKPSKKYFVSPIRSLGNEIKLL